MFPPSTQVSTDIATQVLAPKFTMAQRGEEQNS